MSIEIQVDLCVCGKVTETTVFFKCGIRSLKAVFQRESQIWSTGYGNYVLSRRHEKFQDQIRDLLC